MKRIIALLLCLASLFILCACGAEEKDSDAPETAEPEDVYAPVSFENHGKEIELEEMPQKVVTAGPNCAELMCALGISDLVIGKCMGNHSLGILDSYVEDYGSIPVLCEGYPTYDALKDSGCDFLLTTDWIFNDELTVKSLEKAGITVFVMSTDSIGSMYADIRTIAKIFDVGSRAEEIISTDAALISTAKEYAPEQKLRVLVIDCFLGDKVYVTGGYGYENNLISSAGGINIFAGLEKAWDAVTVEEIIAANPDFIIIHNYQDSSSDDKLAQLQNNAELSQLPCVQEGRILCISLENTFPGVRCGITVKALALAMYPEPEYEE